MRNLIIGSISILLFASCNNDSDNDNNLSNSNQVILKATVETKDGTKAGPIDSDFTTDFSIGVYAYNNDWAAINTIQNDSATVAGAAGHNVTFNRGPYYYPSDGSLLYFFAFAPQAAEFVAAGVGTSPTVRHTINGQQDVMWASATGYKSGSAVAVPPILNFQHKLTQLQFTFKSDTSYPATGNKVVSLLIKAQPTTADMIVGSGVCTFSGSADMQALSSANQTAGINITTAGTNASSPVMTNSASGTSAYLLDIVVKPQSGAPNVTYTNVPVSITTAIGSAHMITLIFTQTAVTATATVAPWVTGTGGSVTVL